LKSVAMLECEADEILNRTNEALCSEENQVEMFVTVWVGILEISTGIITAANAGHEYPVIKNPDGNYELLKDPHGLVIGGAEGFKYKSYQIKMEPGSKLFLYTDGIPEATDTDKNMFGIERMVDALNSKPDADPKETLEIVRNKVDEFVKDAEQFDDLTMMCFEYKGKQ
ncbi:MAG: serine/threonine-protein phosphatase, partial [Mogibacterium sp.]|nr:serine/threonine-protein phosphatase [Mogibacterium sp.]